MKSLRITPINLLTAALISWWIWDGMDGMLAGSKVWVLGLLLLFLVIADQYFRVFIKTIERVWLIQIVFLVLVGAVAFLIRSWLI
jgi:hypothetical protein